jgi:stage II sporulation protein D
LIPQACTHDASKNSEISSGQRIRVRLFQAVPSVNIAAGDPRVFVDSDTTPRTLAFPSGAAVPLHTTPAGWQIGTVSFSTGTLTIQPGPGQNLQINGVAYRGNLRFVPLGDSEFDVINDVDIDDYIKGVVSKEMFPNWPIEAIKAQAIVSRTYALYEAATGGKSRYWDVYPDQRSQVYGGISSETPAGREAVDATAGIVLVSGPGIGKIFKTYFSSCSGGVTAAASDAFGDPYTIPLSEQNHGTCGSESPYFNWGPLTISKQEITHRIQLWAARKSKSERITMPETQMGTVQQIEVTAWNRFHRPTQVTVTDSHGTSYRWMAEQMREAINTVPPQASGTAAPVTLPSSYCSMTSSASSEVITFFDGHGYGHGVGMCQWCAHDHAEAGYSAEQILADAYPQSRLFGAY